MSNDLNTILYNISNQDVYIHTDLDLLDFTSKKKYTLILSTKKYVRIELPLSLDDKEFKETISYLQVLISGDNCNLFAWNIKNLYSYIKGRTGIDFKFNGKLIDLYFFESYLNGNLNKPLDFNEYRLRFLNITKDPLWGSALKIYNDLYKDLIFTIVDIENNFLIDRINKTKVFSHYQIDGQLNGRLKCLGCFNKNYNPHVLTQEDREKLRMPIFDGSFVSFDYKNMEVSLLQWLSKDPVMERMLNEGHFYESLWKELIPNVPFNSNHRKTCKDIFLPLFYGIGIDSLSKKINWPVIQVKKIVSKIYNLFPIAFAWMDNQEKSINNNCCIDFFGRRRIFDEHYKVRNFCVQAPASLICMDRLVSLNKNIKNIAKVCASIHDGYILYCDKKLLNKVCNNSKEILENTSDWYKDLKLKTVCSVGDNLSELNQLNF